MRLFRGFLVSLLMFGGAAQAAVLDISLSPSSATVNPGDAFSMDIMGALSGGTVTNLDAGGLLLAFNPGVIDVTSIVWGSPLADLLTTIDNTTGDAAFAFGNFSTIANPASFKIATLNMTADNPPSPFSTLLNLSADPLNPFVYGGVNVIADADISVSGGVVNVVPLPAAAWLMLSSLAMFGVIGRRRKGAGAEAAAVL